jgi:hypothetical protein
MTIRRLAAAVLLLLTCGCLGTISRKGWNDLSDTRFMSERTFKPEEMQWLKSTTTIFFIRPEDEPNRALFEAAVNRAWHLTPIKVVPISELAQYGDRSRYSYFFIGGEWRVIEVKKKHELTYHYFMQHNRFYLSLVRAGQDPDPMEGATVFSRSELQIEFNSLGQFQTTFLNDDLFGAYYQSARFRNWTPGQVELYLASVERDLRQSHRRWLYEDVSDDAELAKLKSATLLVPDYVLVEFNKYNGDESGRRDPAKLLRRYKHPYKIVTAGELTDAVATSTGPVYVFYWVRSSSDQLVSIFEQGRGIIYRRYRSNTYNLDDDDFDLF